MAGAEGPPPVSDVALEDRGDLPSAAGYPRGVLTRFESSELGTGNELEETLLSRREPLGES
jgi:hypothetical protein